MTCHDGSTEEDTMSRDDRDANEKIRKALRSAYFQKENTDISPFWQGKVMHHVRELAAVRTPERFIEGLGRFLWRLAPVVAFLVLIAGALLTFTDFVSEYEVSQLFFSDPMETSWDLQI